MNRTTLIYKSFIHYLKANLIVAAGIAISTAVLTGGLIIGDSVRFSLAQITNYRLGKTTHTISAGGRFFTDGLAKSMEGGEIAASPVLISEAVAVSEGGANRANKVQVVGVDSSFGQIAGTSLYSGLGRNGIVVSGNLAERLAVKTGDQILLRIKKESLIPLNAPFVSNEETNVSFRAVIKSIASKEETGGFSLKNSQSTPFNIFMDIARLNELMGFDGKANTLLLDSEKPASEIFQEFKNQWTPEDAGLIFREITETGEVEILSERVFVDSPVFDVFGVKDGARGIMTYFANSIQSIKNEDAETPYSFVSTLGENILAENEIIINQWTAADLGVKPGDSLWLKYFVVGPLRQLEEKNSTFIIKDVIGMDHRLSDPTLMPFLPGLSDAGSCRDWEAGVPIDLGKIRDKDEDYWDQYRGTPKAFVSAAKARQIWGNRFGNYTSIRFDKNEYSPGNFSSDFQEFLLPENLGFVVAPVKEQGKFAAEKGVSFSQLFIGLSFFLLVAAILLSALLYLLNIETRSSQIATLTSLGFRQSQVRLIFLAESLLLAVAGGLAGLVTAVIYTKVVFVALNTLWFDIVRTNLLEIKLYSTTLLAGFFVGIAIAFLVALVVIRKKMKQQVADIHKRIKKPEKRVPRILKLITASVFIIFSLALILEQFFLNKSQNPSFFFLSGGLLLVSLLLFADLFLRGMEFRRPKKFTLVGLYLRNLVRNRSRSLAVVVLFAIGAFLVISTGSNKKDLFKGADLKSSGTGGFLWFAETTIPVLFDLNDSLNRVKEDLAGVGAIVQMEKIEGDDASCLNLNLISNPAILGVDPYELEGRFTFASSTPELNHENPWLSLNMQLPGGTVPAIADQTVIQWGLGKKTGDILNYINEAGDTLRLKLIGGLAPSVFQGYVIIGTQNFLKHYPTHSGTSVFLAESDPKTKQEIAGKLSFVFRDYGWEQEDTARKLVEFNSVTNTYLSIFLALGALALILGTIGLAVVVARSIEERKSEIALLQSVGFSNRQVFRLLFWEYSILLIVGLIIGLATAVVATLPSFLSSVDDVSFMSVFVICLAILANGFIWIAGLARLPLRNKKLVTSLRNE